MTTRKQYQALHRRFQKWFDWQEETARWGSHEVKRRAGVVLNYLWIGAHNDAMPFAKELEEAMAALEAAKAKAGP